MGPNSTSEDRIKLTMEDNFILLGESEISCLLCAISVGMHT